MDTRKLLKEDDWLRDFLDETLGAITEEQFNATWTTVEFYHRVGEVLAPNMEELKKHLHTESNVDVMKFISSKIKKSPATVYRAVQFYNKFPDLNALPEGKNTSWRKICRLYLPSLPKSDLTDCLFIITDDLAHGMRKGDQDYNFQQASVILDDDGKKIKKFVLFFSLVPAKTEEFRLPDVIEESELNDILNKVEKTKTVINY